MYWLETFKLAGSKVSLALLPRQATPSVTATCLVTLPAQPQGLVSYSFLLSFFFLISSSFFFFWQHVFFTYFPTSDFDQTWSKWPVPWPLLRHKWWWGQGSRWGHWGQKGHFTKKASSPSDNIALTRDLCICSSLTPSTKVMVLKICPGSFGVTGVKRSFSPKRHQVLQIT